MHHITHNLLDPSLPASKRIHSLWHEYEQRQTREARFVKDLDLIEMALQASEYERGKL
jgi:putative hydrolase of HD superfamily